MRTIESEVTLPPGPDAVYGALTDFAAYPEWNPFLPRMEAEAAEGAPFKAMSKLPVGLKLGFVGEIVSLVPPQRIVWTGRPSFMPAATMHVTHTFTLTPQDGGTHLHQIEEVTGFLMPVSGWILGQARQGQVAMNEALRRRLAEA